MISMSAAFPSEGPILALGSKYISPGLREVLTTTIWSSLTGTVTIMPSETRLVSTESMPTVTQPEVIFLAAG